MPSEDENLIIVLIIRMIVKQRCHSQLKDNETVRRSVDGVLYLLPSFLVVVSSKEQQKEIDNDNDDHREIDRLVSQEISIGKDIIPIDRLGQDQQTTGEAGQMRGEALSLLKIRLRANLERDDQGEKGKRDYH